MEHLIITANLYQQKRDIYFRELEKCELNNKQKTEEKYKKIMFDKNCDNLLDDKIVIQFGESLEKDYILMGNNEFQLNDIPAVFNINPCKLFVSVGNYFETINENNNGDRIIDKTNSTYKEDYYKCVNFLINNQFEIYKVKANVEKYVYLKKYSVGVPFTFECKKGNYLITLAMIYGNNNLNISKITDGHVTIQPNYNMFNKSDFDKFMKITEYEYISDFINEEYKYLINLSELLKECGLFIIDECYISINDSKSFNINKSNEFNFFIKLSNKLGSCLLIPQGFSKECVLYLCRTKENYDISNVSTFGGYKKFDIFYFEHMLKETAETIKYDKINDFKYVSAKIEKYIRITSGNYGYNNVGVYQNDKIVKTFIDSIKTDEIMMNRKIEILEFKCNQDKEFDIFLMCCPCGNSKVCHDKEIFDISYPFDFYGVRFWCDEKNKCFVTIESKMMDLTKFKILYYVDGIKKPDMNLKDINDIIEFNGSFDECFEIIKQFVSDILNISNMKNNSVFYY